MKVSFCTTCMNRLWQLRQTLDWNLEIVRGLKDTELVLLNYGSRDGLDSWIGKYKEDMQLGKLVYAKTEEPKFFHASKAKNVVVGLARGEFIVNLDCDNFLGDWAGQLWDWWLGSPRTVYQLVTGGDGRSTFGRIALSRALLCELGGYDESFFPVGCQDADLLDRIRALGWGVVQKDVGGKPSVPNSEEDKVAHTKCGGVLLSKTWVNGEYARFLLSRGILVRNGGNWGRALVQVNFEGWRRVSAGISWPSLKGDVKENPVFSARKVLFYRMLSESSSRARLQFANRKACFSNMKAVFGDWERWVIVDGMVDQEMVGLLLREPLSIFSSVGTHLSFRLALDQALLLPEETVVYFLSDEYIHRKGASRVLLEGLEKADYVTLYDHPDKYGGEEADPFFKLKCNVSQVLTSQSTHWQVVGFAGRAFAARVATLKRDYDVWGGLLVSDYDACCELMYRRDRTLISPIPAWSTRNEVGLAAPFIDWRLVPGVSEGVTEAVLRSL